MQPHINLSPAEVSEYLLSVAPTRPVFVWGPPGIGKTAVINKFATDLGYECVVVVGSQLMPEDVAGIPRIDGNVARFVPTELLVRDQPYVLFLDEFNGSRIEVQQAFYYLITEQRAGNYTLPKGTIVIAAGNRASDKAIVKPLASPLINRLLHVHMDVSSEEWLAWATTSEINSLVYNYIKDNPKDLFRAPRGEEPFSTPRSWHMLSDALNALPPYSSDNKLFQTAVHGTLTPDHAVKFKTYVKHIMYKFSLSDILKGEKSWPNDPKDSDVLFYLAMNFRSHLFKELPDRKDLLSGTSKEALPKLKLLLKEIAEINFEAASLVVQPMEDKPLPGWFMLEIARDIPRLVKRDADKGG